MEVLKFNASEFALRTLALQLFRELVSRPPEEVDLAVAALVIALDECPTISIQQYLREIDRLARSVRLDFPANDKPIEAIEAINEQLFRVEGFRGNEEDYYDPKNSFLNEVLDRRTGIPITLSVLYLDISKRVGLDMRGVGMPGHFIVKACHHVPEIFVDPFDQGKILLEADCRRRLTQIYGEQFEFRNSYLNEVTHHDILERMLANLKSIYVNRGDYQKTLCVIEKMLVVRPNSPEQIRDRGIANYKLERLSNAVKDWARYLELSPEAPDAEDIAKKLKQIGRLIASRN